MRKILLPLLALFAAAQTTARTVPDWLERAVIYHIYPSTFMDSDGDGIGDLEGIRSKLGYIRATGFNTIWMSPCFASEFEDGGYDITDFYRVDPRFGTNAQLVRLIDEAHALGIRVCLDLVAGHTSDKHPWFRQSCEADTELQYSDYYIWSPSKSDFPSRKFVAADAPRDGNYLKNFFDIQPALNYGYAHPDPAQPWQQGYDDPGPRAVRQEIRRIMDFWMSKGVDGFRCDMAPSLVKGDDEAFTANRRLWREMRAWVEEHHPGCILISEWSQPSHAIDAGFHIDLIIHKGRVGEVYNVGGHNERTNLEVVKAILRALDKPESLIRFVTDRPGHDMRYAIDPTKLETELGWKPRYNFDTGIAQTIDWYLNNREWWEHIISGEYTNYFEQMYGERLE